MPDQEIHIASLIVHSQPNERTALAGFLADTGDLDTDPECPPDNGRWVVIWEGTDAGVILDRMESIEALPGVLGCSLIYHEVMTPQEADQQLIT